MRKTICVLAAAVIGIFAGRTDAQTRISGVIMDLDTGEPLIGAAIMVSNTSEGTVADADGHLPSTRKAIR